MNNQSLILCDDEIQIQVIHIIAYQLHMLSDQVNLTDDMIHNLGIDSLDSVEIITELEKVFGIHIPDDSVCFKEQSMTVGQIVLIVNNLVKDKPEEEKKTLFQSLSNILSIKDEQVSKD